MRILAESGVHRVRGASSRSMDVIPRQTPAAGLCMCGGANSGTRFIATLVGPFAVAYPHGICPAVADALHRATPIRGGSS